MRTLLKILFISLFLTACGESPEDQTNSAQIFTGGTIYTGVDDSPTVEAVVVTDNRITFVGSEAEAKEFAGANAVVMDLGGAYMYPGFIDGHAHLLGIGQRELVLNLCWW